MVEAISRNATVQAVPNQVSSVLGSETVVLQLKTGTYFGLNEVGSRVWALVQQPTTLDAILRAITDEYDVAPETCERDLLELLSSLQRANLVRVGDAQ